MSPHETHNVIVSSVIQQLGQAADSPAELLVMTESLLLGVALVLLDGAGTSPQACSELLDMALTRAMSRLAEIRP